MRLDFALGRVRFGGGISFFVSGIGFMLEWDNCAAEFWVSIGLVSLFADFYVVSNN
jgi:hypothetical protein